MKVIAATIVLLLVTPALALPVHVVDTVAYRLGMVRLEPPSAFCQRVGAWLGGKYPVSRYRTEVFSYRSVSSETVRARLEAAVPDFTYSWFVPWRNDGDFMYRYFMFSQENDVFFGAFIETPADSANVCLAIVKDS